mmetsp:Transcript_85089/g.150467  ORF Transcript_85089/g.150467 Transcript_85089/m.150467 type:complete len:335 (+) Transcript_85089:42-1046(+)|eukprot:CAMPEP_0197658944 /NCGR_PEP_ID=MMETSP1338-20131121/45545_1 /TAXON_ID=43686 ORGANISM="Pelagodinium beii, Strain RCC1491" /NCGR_SAMPLE_ID=MMETSP1338 /ASSEMBLY_ACC=CAM_ASM_000754 /LENGTH=334 /DNA_ID=CAMNT_0043235641 /DNA_START=37 /DNA_END=1041 /DNA_ORIENTATION=-
MEQHDGQDAEDGPLWNTIRRQLYKPEVALIKRLVGDHLIQQNRIMWDEIVSLRAMLADYQEQNEQRYQGQKRKVDFCGTQQRDLLRRQAQLLLEDLRSQAQACGHAVEDLLPELRSSPTLREFLQKDLQPGSGKLGDSLSPPATPSTRPSTSSGYSNSCSTPDLIHSLSSMSILPMGKQLAVDDLDEVAAGIREALEAEQQSLLAAIGEEMQRLEAEDARRINMCKSRGEPSTADLQQFLHKLQDLVVSPSLRALSMGPPPPAGDLAPIVGGANVKRLQALISQRRSQASSQALLAVPEMPEAASFEQWAPPAELSKGGVKSPGFDPFFDDPFA